MVKPESYAQMCVRHIEEDHAYMENAIVKGAQAFPGMDEYTDVVLATRELAVAIKTLREAVDEKEAENV